ncbi:uncharacterized protein LOC131179367 [Hevea brasiliensis]|uniref:uncharacterized protein LOC131179367 n=1 Tax=Hevea brasiliensis TaxID=3981 RepID=UPI0025D2C337|nr:uncharacterized protein LOC131179367 [Hevea brasiliensis]
MADAHERVADASQKDHLALQNSDSPGMVLVSSPLTGDNYFIWSRSMMIALRAKDKLSFITGKHDKSEESSPYYEKWIKADSMVISFLNSISKEIVEAFIYTTSAGELWEDLSQRFGGSNGPQIYQIKREIESFQQGNQSVMVYFTKLKKTMG